MRYQCLYIREVKLKKEVSILFFNNHVHRSGKYSEDLLRMTGTI